MLNLYVKPGDMTAARLFVQMKPYERYSLVRLKSDTSSSHCG